MNRFRIRTSQLFLTYPKCDVTKEEAYQFLDALFRPKRLLVAHELHQDGSNHLHAYVHLENQREFISCNFADINQYHGSYESCRSPKKVIKYCTKEANYISSFDVREMLVNTEAKRDRVGKR